MDKGKFVTGTPALARVPLARGGGRVFAFGPSLNVAPDRAFFEAALPGGESEGEFPVRPLSPVVLGAALLDGKPPEGLPEPPGVSFSAAALAVARFFPMPIGDGYGDRYSLGWEIGRSYWLPK